MGIVKISRPAHARTMTKSLASDSSSSSSLATFQTDLLFLERPVPQRPSWLWRVRGFLQSSLYTWVGIAGAVGILVNGINPAVERRFLHREPLRIRLRVDHPRPELLRGPPLDTVASPTKILL